MSLQSRPCPTWLRWPDDEAAICARIAATRAELKFVLVTRDERELLERWILHHLSLTGPNGLVIFDNGSTDPEVIALYARYADVIEVFGWNLRHTMVFNTTRHRPLFLSLRLSCRNYALIDTDEFACWTDGDRLYQDNLVARLSEADAATVHPGMWWETYHEPAEIYWPRMPLTWGKPLLGASVEVQGSVNHNVFLVRNNPDVRMRGGFVVLHHPFAARERRIRSNVQKCVAHGWADGPEQIDTIIAAGNFERLPEKFRVYLREIVHCRAPAPHPAPRLLPGTLAVGEDGRLDHGSPEIARQLRQFATAAEIPAHAIDP
ncbi:MAG: hypothetical protein ACKOSQ_02785 [Planctomycetaceae bacterium]